jgi:hypothetical protein
VADDGLPATGVADDGRGHIWAIWGLAHGLRRRGTLRVREEGRWRTVIRCDNEDRGQELKCTAGATSFEDLAVRGTEVFLLSGRHGVLQLAADGLRPRTPGWTAPATAMGLDGARVFIGGYDKGVWVRPLDGPDSAARRLSVLPEGR